VAGCSVLLELTALGGRAKASDLEIQALLSY
jgi:hypothetical protein